MKIITALSVTAMLCATASAAQIHCLTTAANGFVRNAIPGVLNLEKNSDGNIELTATIDGIDYSRTYLPDDDLRVIPAYDDNGTHSITMYNDEQRRHDDTIAAIWHIDALTQTTETVYTCETDADIDKDDADKVAWSKMTPAQREAVQKVNEKRREAQIDAMMAESQKQAAAAAAKARAKKQAEYDKWLADTKAKLAAREKKDADQAKQWDESPAGKQFHAFESNWAGEHFYSSQLVATEIDGQREGHSADQIKHDVDALKQKQFNETVNAYHAKYGNNASVVPADVYGN
ncbi:hypothetical protein [Pseudenterobacter timonensis]|uniref:Uncharacterized protein n=1 Tax=Pseudenterobacter timonensis TaxID=1755099 RepID=A0ABV4AE12_9ENTR